MGNLRFSSSHTDFLQSKMWILSISSKKEKSLVVVITTVSYNPPKDLNEWLSYKNYNTLTNDLQRKIERYQGFRL